MSVTEIAVPLGNQRPAFNSVGLICTCGRAVASLEGVATRCRCGRIYLISVLVLNDPIAAAPVRKKLARYEERRKQGKS